MHGDLKWENFVLQGNGTYQDMKLIDFGCSIKISQNAFVTINRPVGTSYFCAPEIFLENRRSKASDVYALGMMLFTIVKGVPFNTRNLPMIYALISEGRRPSTSQTPPGIASLITKCWQQNPKARPSAAEVHQEALKLAEPYQNKLTI
jgi:serine/threonine protein kinase